MRTASLAVAALLLAPHAASAQDGSGPPIGELIERYEATTKRPALFLRYQAIEALARTRHPEALEALARRYRRPEPPKDHVRYLVAGVLGEHFRQAGHVPALRELAERHDDAEDAWLWFQVLVVQSLTGGGEAVLEVAADAERDPFLRAAALEALARTDQPRLILRALPLVLEPPLRGRARAVLAEAGAAALMAARSRVKEPEFAAAAELVIGELEADGVSYRTQVVLARHLARTFAHDQLYLTSSPWRSILQGKVEEARRAAGEEVEARTRARVVGGASTPRFLGIEGAGVRVAYVVDLSDSMLEPLSTQERDDLRRPYAGGTRTRDAGPTSTGGEPRGGGDAAEAGAGAAPDLPWDRIRTRFDAAREALVASLRGLEEDVSFAVIVFGTEAEQLVPRSGLLPATRRNIDSAVRALEAIRPGPRQSDRPHGTLRGRTNLHGALRAAFRIAGRRPIAEHEHVAADGFEEGVDTVFVLSDGEPSWDDFDAVDRREANVQAGDPETGKKLQNQPLVRYYGPYILGPVLLRDLLRMNMFRKVEVHCVGIGEADGRLLQTISAMGLGELRQLGN